VRDPGGDKLLVHQSGMRLSGRIQQRHPGQRHARPKPVEDRSDRCPDLVVSVTRGDDRRPRRRLQFEGALSLQGRAEALHRRHDAVIRPGRTRQAHHHAHRHAFGQRRHETAGSRCDALRKVHHDRTEVTKQRPVVRDFPDRCRDDILLVVPVA
jgi:hypothetical protein